MSRDVLSFDSMSELAADFPPATYEQWEALVRAKEKDPERALTTTLEEGIEVDWLYAQADSLAPDPGGVAGSDPFVRGSRAGGPWAIRQQNGASDRREANKQILEDLEGGATEVLLTLNTSPDGSAGIPVSDVDQLAEVLDRVYLDLAPVALDCGPHAAEAAQLLLELWRRSGHPAAEVRGSLRLDPIGTLALAGDTDPDRLTTETAAAIKTLTEVRAEFPAVRVLAADATPYVEAGAGATLELALVLATALRYLRAADDAGVDPSALAAGLEFTLVAGADQFLEIAKLRAARRLWATILHHCGVDADQRRSATYVRTSRRMVSALDPWVNLLRATIAAFAAAVAGADGITVLPFDEPATGEPGPLGRRMARNTQLVLLEESSLHRVADPAGGSWYVESLTDQLARAAWAELQKIEGDGGITALLASGRVAERLTEETAKRHDELARRRRALTGVNTFPLLGDDGLERVERAESGDADLALDSSLEDAAASPPPVHKTGDTGTPLVPVRDAAQFEELRARAIQIGEPKIVLVNVGPLAEYVNVSMWAKSFFEAGGVETVSQPEDQVALDGAKVVAVCAGRDADPAPAIAKLRDAGVKTVYLVGAKQDAAEAAGADVGVRDGVDMVAVLGALLDRFEGDDQ
jgi:methylmalonyl-CoA mutase